MKLLVQCRASPLCVGCEPFGIHCILWVFVFFRAHWDYKRELKFVIIRMQYVLSCKPLKIIVK
jgi:hypothetical protein